MPETDGVLARAQKRVQHASNLVKRQQDLVRCLRENGLLAAASAAERGVSALQRQLERAQAHKRDCQKQESVTA